MRADEDLPAVRAFLLHLGPFMDAILAEELLTILACHRLVEKHLTDLADELVHVRSGRYVGVGEMFKEGLDVLLGYGV